MTTLYDIQRRAEELSRKRETASITPEEVGDLIRDLSSYAMGMERDGSTLGIRKIYPSLEAMQSDSDAPTTEDGKPLRRGNLVAIYQESTATTDPNSGLVSMWTGSQWVSVARIGTALRHENTALESRLSKAERTIAQELQPTDSELRTALEGLSNDIQEALDRLEYTTEERDKLGRIREDGDTSEYLASDGRYHRLPIRSVEVNGTMLSADKEGKVSISTPQGTVQSLTLSGSKLTPNEEGDISLGLRLSSEPIEGKRIKVGLKTDEGLELSSIELPQGGSGSGSGFLNITREVPLTSGYYSLSGALSAMRSLAIPQEARLGCIISIQPSEGKWADYRYVGSSVEDSAFYSAPLWQEYATRVEDEHIKSLIQAHGQEIDVAESLDDTHRPVASSVVKHAIDELRDLKLDADVEADDEGSRVTISRGGNKVTEFVVRGGGAGGGSSTKAVVTAQLSSRSIKLGDRVSLTYGFSHFSDGVLDGTSATMELSLKRGVETLATLPLGSLASGATRTIDLSSYITSADSYNLLVVAKYEEEGQLKERKAGAVLSVVNLSIDLYNRGEIEAYLASGGYKDGDTANVILSVRGGAREITMLIDGDESTREVRPLVGSGRRQTFALPIRTLSPGSHSLQFVASLDGLDSNSIYLDILKWGAETPFVGLLFSRPDGYLIPQGQTPELLAHQYEEMSWHYFALGTKAGGVAQLSLTSPSGTSTFSTPASFQRQPLRSTGQGLLAYSYALEGMTKPFHIKVEPTTLSGLGIKEGAIVELLASGRSNVEANPEVWTSGSTSTTFEGVDFASSGWTGESLRLINGSRALVGYQPFAQDAKRRGLTLTFEVRMTNVRRPLGSVVSCLDEEARAHGSFAGFDISASRVLMSTGGELEFRSEDGEVITRSLGLNMPYASGEYYSLTLVVHPAEEEKTIRLYINGVLSKADTYQDTLFQQRNPKGILLDSTWADLEVRHIRLYETALSDDEVLQNYITDRPTLSEMEYLRERNDVLSDETGEISYHKLVSRGKAVLSIAMPDGGLERLWGKSTDTKTDHSFTELIFRSPLGRAYDLKVTDGIIRRQGTSTSTYPIKNLRIYLQKAKTTKVYRNISQTNEDEWQEVEERTYVMREGAKPMKIINLKTDYADSSMCYNTGTAILLNDYLIARNASLRNPGQKADPSARMAIDGIPIDLFTSSAPEGEKTYCGQFLFNNDKSKSGYLFGQTKKDGSEIALEFINNTNPVANFHISASSVSAQLAREGTDGFDASVEFLYPEADYMWNSSKPEQVAPEHIKQAVIRLWQFIHDCTPRGVDPSDMTEEEIKRAFHSEKFKREVAQYFDITNLCMWWVLTDYHMSVDQRVKNTFFRTWGDGIWWLTYYDGDTAFGKRNDAFLAYDYNINRDTRDLQRGKYAFEGHNSRLWCLVVANLSEELRATAKTLRATLTNRVYLSVFNDQIMGSWSERQYNKSGIYKYIKPTYTDYNGGGFMNYIFALNGTMYAYRNQLIERRFSMLDAKYLVGQYESDAVTGYIGKDDSDTTIRVTASDEYYFAWKTQNGNLTEHQRTAFAGEVVFNFRDAMSQNDPVRLIGASRMRRIDFASTAQHLQGSWNFNSCKHLEELIAPTSEGRGMQWYPLLGRISSLKHIDLSGQRGITGTEDEQARSFDVSSHTGLTTLKLQGTNTRAIRLALGCPITLLELPSTLSYLRLRALPKLTMSGLVLSDWSKVTTLEMGACPLLEWRTILERCTSLERLRIEGVDFIDDGSLLRRLLAVKGIDANGSAVDTCSLVGRCQLSVYLDEEEVKTMRAHFPSLVIRQPAYTIVELDDSIPNPNCLSNLDNETGYKFGKEYKPSGHIAKILSERFGCLGKQTERGRMEIYRLHHDNWLKFSDHEVQSLATDSVLNGTEGDIFVYEPEYWYKGVNDILRKKKYFVYATEVAPERGECHVITHQDIERQGGKMVGTACKVGLDQADCIAPNNEFSTLKVSVKGYKRVRCQMVTSPYQEGASFFDEQGGCISGQVITTAQGIGSDGDYIIMDVPERADTMIFTVNNAFIDQEPYVVLSNSSKIEDMEPEWVHRRARLVGALHSLFSNGKMGSFYNGGTIEEPTLGLTYQQVEKALDNRGLRMQSYESHKDIINLAFVKYGTKNFALITGFTDNRYNWSQDQGTLLRSGIQDTSREGSKEGYYKIDGQLSTRVTHEDITKTMGYERLTGGPYYQYLGGAFGGSYWRDVDRSYIRSERIIDDEGRERIISFARTHNETSVMRLVHGKHMDIFSSIPAYSAKVETRDFGTYYGSGSNSWSHEVGGILLHQESRYHDRGVVALCTNSHNIRDAKNRCMFIGQIHEMKNLGNFIAIKNFL